MMWQRSSIAPDGTHHLLDGEPMYAMRFNRVQKYHAPGLAPVVDASGAFHIATDGKAAYPARFLQAWGFYEGRAAVQDQRGWFHILADGRDLTPERFDWCGNFQNGRCTVREHSGLYFHITESGKPAYPERYLYAGDFRDGSAVIRCTESGLCTHINPDGRRVHNQWFIDLDVFHKGYARARDRSGWFHVDTRGRPLTHRRYAEVEPFYNGQARVLTHDGEYQVVNERGHVLASVGRHPHDRFHQVSALLVGNWSTDTIAAAVSLGVFDRLPARCAELAGAIAAPEDSVMRLLGALWELGLVDRREGGLWEATPTGQLLDRRATFNLADAATEYGGPLRGCWSRLGEAIRSPQWRPLDVFASAATDPDRTRGFQRMLAIYAQHDYSEIARMLPFQEARTIVDVAGGTGVLASMIADQFPAADVVVLERPEVCELACAGRTHPRVRFVSGDLFDLWPVRADGFVMSRVLHDWNDDDARRILRHARAAMSPGGTGVIIEMLLDDATPFGRLCDLHLMAVTGGRERTLDQIGGLVQEAGFRVMRVEPTPSIVSTVVVEAV
ncbi:MAG: methyltransferase domain-containing protein [Phycisphaerae bacterium]|nr:methyltransferase domain-containing protein [Phycisphaerae bacterium]